MVSIWIYDLKFLFINSPSLSLLLISFHVFGTLNYYQYINFWYCHCSFQDLQIRFIFLLINILIWNLVKSIFLAHYRCNTYNIIFVFMNIYANSSFLLMINKENFSPVIIFFISHTGNIFSVFILTIILDLLRLTSAKSLHIYNNLLFKTYCKFLSWLILLSCL